MLKNTVTRKFHLHRGIIVVICFAMLLILLIAIGHFSKNQQTARYQDASNIAHLLVKQVGYQITPLLTDADKNQRKILAVLNRTVDKTHILDISVYQLDGTVVAQTSNTVDLRQQLVPNSNNYQVHQQIVETLYESTNPVGFIRMTLNAETLLNQTEYDTLLFRLMLLAATATGFIVARVLVNKKPVITSADN